MIAVGDRRPYNVALVVLEPDAAVAFSSARQIGEHSVHRLAAHPEVTAEVQRAVKAANESLAGVEQIKKFEVLPRDWTVEGGELTPR